MNYSRFQNRSYGPQQDRPAGSNLHEFIEGLSKIAQIMYTSIPIIEFVRIASKYGLKFFEFIGVHMLKVLGIMKVQNKPEVILENLWKKESWRQLLTRHSTAIALAVIVFCLVCSKPELEDEWPVEVRDEGESRKPEVMSVEDKPVAEAPEYFDEYSGYPMYG
jgi:hypothetical protein